MQKKSDHDVNLQCLTLQVALTMGRCRSRIAETGALFSAAGSTSGSKSGSLIWPSLSRKRPEMRSSPQPQRRGLDRQAILHTIYGEKGSKYGGYSGEYPTKFLWKTIEKNIKFDSFLYAFWERGDDELLHVQRRMHPEAPESSRKAERLRIKPGDSNIKVIHWFKMNLQQYVKTFFT